MAVYGKNRLQLCLLSISWMPFLFNVVSSYDDLRQKSCRSEMIRLPQITGDQVEWSGSISFQLVCDPGFDLPLNVHDSAHTVTCNSNNRWEPDYVPDCNKEVVPIVKYTYAGKLGKCKEKDSIMKDICNDPEFKCKVISQTQTGCSAAGDSSAFTLNVEIPYNKSQKNVPAVRSALTTKILDQMSPLDESKLKSSLQCPRGTTAVFVDKDMRCRGCPIGEYLNFKTKTCNPCPVGHYQDTPLSIECKICPSVKSLSVTDPVWNHIRRVCQNRMYNMLYCPQIFIAKNNSRLPMCPPGDFEKQMDSFIQERERHISPAFAFNGYDDETAAPSPALLGLVVTCVLVSLL